ncbi:MAG TPA: hypothetical protein VGM43_17115 [Bryobacteraceae bacterium]
MTPLEQWLSEATRGLSPESAGRVREEIQEHYDSACDAGGDAIAALGSPREANRAYRKVLLTEREAIMAPTIAQRKRSSPSRIALSSVLLVAFVWMMLGRHHDPSLPLITLAIFCTLPMTWFFPPATLARCRIYTGVYEVRSVLIAAIVWWYNPAGWMWGLAIAVIIFLIDYFPLHRQRLSIFRKFEAGQTWSPLPKEPQLTHLEAIILRRLSKPEQPYEIVCAAVLCLILAAMAVWMPAAFAPMAIFVALDSVARRTLPIYTRERSRVCRIFRWTAMAVAALLPLLCHAAIPWVGAAFLTWIFVLFDWRNILIRRKLPVSEWPKGLYW